MELLELRDFSDKGAFFEDDFDKKFAAYDWNRFNKKAVRISNCGLTNVPGWAYLIIGIELSKRAKRIYFGDNYDPKKIFRRENEPADDPKVKHAP